MQKLLGVAILCCVALTSQGCQAWLTDATNTPSGPLVRADRFVLNISADTFNKSVPPSARQAIPGSSFSLAIIPLEDLGRLQNAEPVFAEAQLPAVGWPVTTDLWSYRGSGTGDIQIGARVLADKSLQMVIHGDVDADAGSPTAPRGPLSYNGHCSPESVFVFFSQLKDTQDVYVIVYRITEVSSVRRVSPTWGLAMQ